MTQPNNTSIVSGKCNELNRPLLDDSTNNNDVEKQNQPEDNRNRCNKNEPEDEVPSKNPFCVGLGVGLIIFPNAFIIQSMLALLNYHIYQHNILTNAQIQNCLIHGAISVLLLLLVIFTLPTKFVKEQKQKILCRGHRLFLLTGMLLGNVLSIFTTVFLVKTVAATLATNFIYIDYFKQLLLVSLYSSLVFSAIISMSYQYIPCEDEDCSMGKTGIEQTTKLITV